MNLNCAQYSAPARIPFPPLPEELPLNYPAQLDPSASTSDEFLRFFRRGAVLFDTGAYLINYQPVNSPLVSSDGTLRMVRGNLFSGFSASGDLYQRKVVDTANGQVLEPAPDPRRGFPIFPIKQYRLYLRVTQLDRSGFFTGGRARFGFELYRFDSGNWTQEPGGTFTTDLALLSTPRKFQSNADYFEGDVTDGSGKLAGRMSMGWVSPSIRKAIVEFDRVANADDLNVGQFAGVYRSVGWEINVEAGDTNIAEPNGEFWTDAEMHQALLSHRNGSDLDSEWRFYLLGVRRIVGQDRGVMFDTDATDSNKVPREGAGISGNWPIPNSDPWGRVKGQRFGATGLPYTRTAVHEIGHAAGLVHNFANTGIMNTTDEIARVATAQMPFPDNVLLEFHSDDVQRLRHFPDLYVRPGGTAFGAASNTNPPISSDEVIESPHLQFRVIPVLEAIPLGAPVRVNLELVNAGPAAIMVPARIGLKDDFVCGRVVDPSGTARSFSSMVLCMDSEELVSLGPGENMQDSLTLLRGKDGALFPMDGIYAIEVLVEWKAGDLTIRVKATAHVIVTSPADDAHAIAALKVLTTPDTLPVLVIGGDHLLDGLSALDAALANPTLRPHYTYTQAKRLSEPFYSRPADPNAAANLIDRSTVLNEAEMRKAARMCSAPDADPQSSQTLAATLFYLANSYNCSPETLQAIETLCGPYLKH